MRNPYVSFLFALSCAVLYASTCPVFAKAPTTAKIAFSSWRHRNLDIYLMNPDGSEEVRLTHHLARDGGPKWSPSGDRIIFSSDRDGAPGDWDLYLMDADGSNVQRVFKKESARTSPTWSPDGKQIAYSRWEQGKSFIYIASIDGKKEERIALGSQPAWSPDGTEIAFIEVLDVRTRKHKFFFPPKEPAWVRHHAWSPEGDRLAFAWYNRIELRQEDFKLETIYIVNRDGTGLQQIIEEGKRAVEPVWSPRGDALLYSQLDKNDMQQIFKVTLAIPASRILQGTGSIQPSHCRWHRNPNWQQRYGDD
ncbi:PD40 domain-containing protein [Candidatus Poribacteria bacterium]|nr:PD40 domain-containing protein [Candidatus Poribacteria bacterium]